MKCHPQPGTAGTACWHRVATNQQAKLRAAYRRAAAPRGTARGSAHLSGLYNVAARNSRSGWRHLVGDKSSPMYAAGSLIGRVRKLKFVESPGRAVLVRCRLAVGLQCMQLSMAGGALPYQDELVY